MTHASKCTLLAGMLLALAPSVALSQGITLSASGTNGFVTIFDDASDFSSRQATFTAKRSSGSAQYTIQAKTEEGTSWLRVSSGSCGSFSPNTSLHVSIGTSAATFCVRYGILTGFNSGTVLTNGDHFGAISFSQDGTGELATYVVRLSVFPEYGFKASPQQVNLGLTNEGTVSVAQDLNQLDAPSGDNPTGCAKSTFSVIGPSYINPSSYSGVSGWLGIPDSGSAPTATPLKFTVNRSALQGIPAGTTFAAIVQLKRNASTGCVPNVSAAVYFTVSADGSTSGGGGSDLKLPNKELKNGRVDQGYPTEQITPTGGRRPYLIEVVDGTFPPGLKIDSSSGAITGTPTQADTYIFGVQVTDDQGAIAIGNYQIKILPAAVHLSGTQGLPAGQIGKSYGPVTLQAAGGTGMGYTYHTAGKVPAGISLSETGVLGGTPEESGPFQFDVIVTDSGNESSDPTTLFLYISPAAGAPVVDSATLPPATLSQPYMATIHASGGAPSYTFELAGGTTPPPGITLESNGNLTGTPTQAGTFSFQVRAKDANAVASAPATFTIDVAGQPGEGQPLFFQTTFLDDATRGDVYQKVILAAGGKGPYTFSFDPETPVLPPGLNLSTTGVLSGTPSKDDFYVLTVRVTDSSAPVQTATAKFGFTVKAATRPLGTLSLTPAHPDLPLDASTSVTLTWQAINTDKVDIHVNGPDGPSLTGVVGPTGTASTDGWVVNGLTFYLQDAQFGDANSAARTLAKVEVFYQVNLGPGPYRLTPANSAMPAAVRQASVSAGATVVQTPLAVPGGTLSQRFYLEPAGGSLYRIVAAHSGKAIEPAVPYPTDDTAVVQAVRRTGDDLGRQLWQVSNATDGRFLLLIPGTDLALSVQDASTDADAPLILRPFNGLFGSAEQQFAFEAIDDSLRLSVLAPESNPLRLKPEEATGSARLYWRAAGTNAVQIRVVGPGGPTFYTADKASAEPAVTDPWVGDGLEFYLQDAQKPDPGDPSATLAFATVYTTHSTNYLAPAVALSQTMSAAPAGCPVDPPAATEFANAQVVHYLLLQQPAGDAFVSDVLRTEWLDPQGRLFQSDHTSVLEAGFQCSASTLPASAAVNARPGVWRVNRYWNETLISSSTFTVK